jgi:hypothetical protein
MIKTQIFKNHFDEQGSYKMQKVSIQSTCGTSPEENGISLHQWALSIRCQANLVYKKLHKQEKETNYFLFNPKTK